MFDLIVYQPTPDISISIAADVAHRMIWATQKQISEALDISVQAVSDQILKWKKSHGERSIKRMTIVQTEGNRQVEREVEHYNMTVILFVGFNAKASKRVIAFQDWAGEQLDSRIAELQQTSRALDPLDQLKMTVAIMEQQREDMRLLQAQQASLNTRVEHVEDTLEAADGAPQMMTVAAYAKWKNLRLADGELSGLGRKATVYSNANGYPVTTTPHGVYGTIHKYHVDVLKLIFSQRTLFENKK